MNLLPLKMEQKTVNLLLERGVKVQTIAPLFLRIFGKKEVSFTVKAPSARTLIKIAGESLTIDKEVNKELSLQEATELIFLHGKTVSKIVALAILNGNLSQFFFTKILAAFLANRTTATGLCNTYAIIMLFGGIEDFTNTIRFIKTNRITKPMIKTSPKEKMS